jgi:hypothetical protein
VTGPAALRALAKCAGLVVAVFSHCSSDAQENFKRSGGRGPYAHHLPLFDAQDLRIDPSVDHPQPYSPLNTCKKCHDYRAIAEGHHFNARVGQVDRGRSGEPWIWVHRQTGSQIPISQRAWPGTYRPADLGLADFDFIKMFGAYLCGGGIGEPNEVQGEWSAIGRLEIDCMICHAGGRSYRHEARAKQIEQENFRWAATAAIGLAQVEGSSSQGQRGEDAAADDQQGKAAVKLVYDAARFDAAGDVFFDIVRRPDNGACFACHSAQAVGESTQPQWLTDHDVHLRAGMRCADCHRNGIEHMTVRGFEGESRPDGLSVEAFSCRGCHLGEGHESGSQGAHDGGRLGAPRPAHRGLPPIHLERMSCTSCHCGPLPKLTQQFVQTSMAHRLGMASQTRQDSDPPQIVQPVFRKDEQGILHPYRVLWPAFWGWKNPDRIVPANPETIHRAIRRTLRVRSDFRQELQPPASKADSGDGDGAMDATFRARITASLKALAGKPPSEKSEPVYVAGGKVYRLGPGEQLVVETGAEEAAPYTWALGHDVRPARLSLGSQGCQECHADAAPIFHSVVRAVGPAPDPTPIERPMYVWSGYDSELLAAWQRLFRLRSLFKWSAAVAIALVASVLVVLSVRGLEGVMLGLSRRLLRRRRT